MRHFSICSADIIGKEENSRITNRTFDPAKILNSASISGGQKHITGAVTARKKFVYQILYSPVLCFDLVSG